MSIAPLKLRNVRKGYQPGLPILDDVDLALEAGEAIALVGVNGAGKTTLIKAILDFISIEQGRIEIFGKASTDHRAREKLVYLPERFQPPYYLVGRQFLQMMTRLYHAEYDESRVERYLRSLDLPEKALDQPVREYSKGMAQKLGLIGCLNSQRPLLIMDEPMSGLDPRARYSFKRLLAEVSRQGRTLFFSTHLLADVSSVCDRLAILHEGRIRFIGSPQACCEQYERDDLESAYMACINAETV